MKHRTIFSNNYKFKNQTMSFYMHYILTYTPIFGALLGGFYLSNILLEENRKMKKTIYLIFIFSAILSIYSFSIIKFQNLTYSFSKEDYGWMSEKITFIYLTVSSLTLLGFLSLVGLFFMGKNYSKEVSLGIVISILALFSSIFSIRSEYIHPSWKFYTNYINQNSIK
jgi:hypothetical protein